MAHFNNTHIFKRDDSMGGSSASAFKSAIGIIIAALIGVPLFAYLAIKLATSGMSTDLTSSTMTKEAVAARLQPVGVVKVVDGQGFRHLEVDVGGPLLHPFAVVEIRQLHPVP